jgi:hypothetical protein
VDDFMPYMLMQYTSIFLGPVLISLIMLPVVIYVVARWRAYRELTAPDPQLGIKCALAWFKMVSYQMLLMGLFMFLYPITADLPEYMSEGFTRTAMGMLLPAGLVFTAHHFILKQTNAEFLPTAPRMFAGLSLIQTGLIAFFALVMGGILLFQKNTPSEINRPVMVLIFIYGGAWVGQGISYFRQLNPHSVPAAVATQTSQASQAPSPYQQQQAQSQQYQQQQAQSQQYQQQQYQQQYQQGGYNQGQNNGGNGGNHG